MVKKIKSIAVKEQIPNFTSEELNNLSLAKLKQNIKFLLVTKVSDKSLFRTAITKANKNLLIDALVSNSNENTENILKQIKQELPNKPK